MQPAHAENEGMLEVDLTTINQLRIPSIEDK
jgi:hypothetical protein